MKTSSTSCSDGSLRFIAVFLALAIAGTAAMEWVIRTKVLDGSPERLLAKRVAAVYEERNWPVLGNSRLGDVLVGDSQMHMAFHEPREFFKLALAAETVPMLDILVEEYFKFRRPGRVIVAAGPQLFAQAQFDNGTRKHDTYFRQNNPVQHALHARLFVAEPGVANEIGTVAERALAPYLTRLFPPHAHPAAAVAGDPAADGPWNELPMESRRKFAALRLAKQRPVPGFEQSEHFHRYRKMVAFLAEKGADICFLRLPISPEYAALVDRDPQYVQASNAFRALAKETGRRYVDFADLPMAHDDRHFMNQDHLSVEGAKVFAPLATAACFSGG
jgi:hypothetical protein